MERILPIGEPMIKCFMFDAIPLSILAVKNDYLDWFYSNYIQLCCRKNIKQTNELFLQFYGPDQAFDAPCLKKQYFSWKVMAQSEVDIISLIKTNIKNGYYYYGYLDDYYLNHRPSYMSNHYPHDIFLYGFNNKKKIFYSLGYTINHMLEYFEVEYETFVNAFYNDHWNRDDYSWVDRIYLFQYDNTIPYELDLPLMKSLLHDYYASANTSERYRRYGNPVTDSLFGMQIYEGIKEYYRLLSIEEIRVDLRVAFILKEHKECMQKRLQYIEEKYQDNRFSPYIEYYKILSSKAETLLSQQIKYSLTGKKSMLEHGLELVDDIYKTEKEIIPGILELLDKIV